MLRSVAYLAEAFFAKLGHCTQGKSVARGDVNGVNEAATQSRPLAFVVCPVGAAVLRDLRRHPS
jgi:hypothetical protein